MFVSFTLKTDIKKGNFTMQFKFTNKNRETIYIKNLDILGISSILRKYNKLILKKITCTK